MGTMLGSSIEYVVVRKKILLFRLLSLNLQNKITYIGLFMDIAGRGHIEYINRKRKQPNKDEQSWNQWYLKDN